MNNNKKMNLTALILMIFTSVFGFTNIPRSFYLMGYSAIPWYIVAALIFFIPYAFMLAEYGAAFKNERGGIYSWMEKSVSSKYAFIGTFMWYISYVMAMVNVCFTIWIVISTAIFGKDITYSWNLFGLNSTQTMGLLGVLLIIFITFIATKGLEKITKVTSIAGIAITLLNVVLLVGSLTIFILNKGELAQPIESFKTAITTSPNPDYLSPLAIISFLVFSIFSFGGIEVVGGLSDKIENADKTFPKGVTIAAFIISIGYAIGIFLCGVFTNWNDVLSLQTCHMGNIAYILMENLGYQLGLSIGLTQNSATTLGLFMARYIGLSMALAFLGAVFALTYSPLKQLIGGTPKKMWPKYFSTYKNDMPISAMWTQCIIVCLIIIVISFGGEGATAFFAKLTLMTNIAITVPYIFIAGAFPAFKRNKDIIKPFEIYKNKKVIIIATILTTLSVIFANISTILSPYLEKNDLSSTLWMLAGPVIFTLLALIIFYNYERKLKK